MKKYYILTANNEIIKIGEFEQFLDAWEYLNYESNINFVWLISENKLRYIREQIEQLNE